MVGVRRSRLLIVGGESDPNTRRVIDQAHIREVDYSVWDTDRTESIRVAWDFDSPRLDLDATTVEPHAVFLRYNVFAGDPGRNAAVFEAVQAFLLAWPQIGMLNRPVVTDANNKSRNLRWARESGFEIPKTLVMADLSPLRTMPDPSGHVIKPLGGGAHTRPVASAVAEPDRLGELGPQFVQNHLRGENLRLFSIGGRMFAFRLTTSAVDYRDDDDVGVEAIGVPGELVEPTRRLVERTEFDYCALDFRCVEGVSRPVFLEINSFPMFVRFDDAADNALADAILDFLIADPATEADPATDHGS